MLHPFFLIKKFSFLIIIVFAVVSCEKFTYNSKDGEIKKINHFIELRKKGETEKAFRLLSQNSRNVFSIEDFERYCFIYKIVDTEVKIEEKSGYYVVTYSFYDKKFDKENDALYTFYISENSESIRVDDSGIVFPHTGFTVLRNNIENRDMASAKNTVEKMLAVDSNNPDVIKSAQKMGFIQDEN